MKCEICNKNELGTYCTRNVCQECCEKGLCPIKLNCRAFYNEILGSEKNG